MPADPSGPAVTAPRGVCRCGHYPCPHMLVRPAPGASGFRLEPSGPCAICGEANCRAYAPAGSRAEER